MLMLRQAHRSRGAQASEASRASGRRRAENVINLRAMNGTKNDADPKTELREDDEESALPELEAEIDLAAAGPLAAGRAVILNHARLAPSSPGVYRMIDANGEVLYVGKAKNIRKRIIAYARPTGYDSPLQRMIAAPPAP